MITKEDINKAERENIAINKALKIEKAKNESTNDNTQDSSLVKASKNRKQLAL